MTQEPDRTSGHKDLSVPLPVWGTVVDSYRTVFIEYRGHLPRALCVPFLLSLLLSLLTLHVTDFGAIKPEGLSALGAALFWRAAFAVPFVLFAVSWHCLMLFGPKDGRPSWWPSLGQRHVAFFGYVVLAAVVFLLFGEVLTGVVIVLSVMIWPTTGFDYELGFVIGFLCSLVASYIVVRICFVFPAAAADRAYPLIDAWADTKPIRWHLFAAVIVTALPYTLFRFLFHIVSDGNQPLSMPGAASAASWQELAAILMANEAVVTLAAYLTAALGASLVSRVFMDRVGWKTPSGKVAPQSRPEPASKERNAV